MSFLRVSQNNEEFLLNCQHIAKISKGKGKHEFLIALYYEAFATIYEVFGEGGRKCEKLLAVKRIIDGKE